MNLRFAVLVAMLVAVPMGRTQDAGLDEIVVTGQIRSRGAPAVPLPAVAIRERADFLLQAVEITNDTSSATIYKAGAYGAVRCRRCGKNS
jgi:hypothetical protein